MLSVVKDVVTVQESLLEELNQWYTDAASSARSANEALKKTEREMHEAVRFAERLLNHGSAEMLPLRKVVLRRLHALSSALPHSLSSMKLQNSIEFNTDETRFYAVLQASFGHFASTDDHDGVSCCKKIDDLLPLFDKTYPRSDVADERLIAMSKVCICATQLVMLTKMEGKES